MVRQLVRQGRIKYFSQSPYPCYSSPSDLMYTVVKVRDPVLVVFLCLVLHVPFICIYFMSKQSESEVWRFTTLWVCVFIWWEVHNMQALLLPIYAHYGVRTALLQEGRWTGQNMLCDWRVGRVGLNLLTSSYPVAYVICILFYAFLRIHF